jgi:redox-sensitive bicupin YhaK (pirin superfamily)
MSIINSAEAICAEKTGTCGIIELTIEPKVHELGGFNVRRTLPSRTRRMIGPWIFFDHMGPASFDPGEGIDVRPHPHINLATVTYLFEGEILHRDSLGNELAIIPGEINLMVAGKGIVHSERQRENVKLRDNKLEGLQLWLALPRDDEEMDPEFHHYDSSEIPSINVGDVPVRVLIGSAYGVTSPVKTFAETLYIEVRLKKGQSLKLPENTQERGLYIVNGQLSVNSSVLKEYTMTTFHPNQAVVVTADEETKLVVIGGDSLHHRNIYWNFVSTSKERIEQAKQDWSNDRFPKVINDEAEFIPLPNS